MTHIPVLIDEVIKIVNPKPGEFFIDGTLGNGGHAEEIIKRIAPDGVFLGIDWDKSAVEGAKIKLGEYGIRKIFLNENYASLVDILQKYNLPKAEGLVLDLGFSSTQIEGSEKGFSFQKDEPLDMRYNQNESRETAAEFVNRAAQSELARVLWEYGEEGQSRQIAKSIAEERRKEKILTTKQLVDIIEKTKNRHGKIHPATQTFQALRICVNQELENLKRVLREAEEIVEEGGRIAIISFHSLEDRIIKQEFKKIEKEGGGRRINKKVIHPSWEEVQKNPRSRSAKLRAIVMANKN
ncbi:16S rRNA (cytosine(1402)-N(4))-methyltransferase [bacterium]|nr:16S rRNA (cytosine(1402)-N(4))-methyltransferase [bacterium]